MQLPSPRVAEQGGPPKIALWGSALRTMCYLWQCASPSAPQSHTASSAPDLVLFPEQVQIASSIMQGEDSLVTLVMFHVFCGTLHRVNDHTPGKEKNVPCNVM